MPKLDTIKIEWDLSPLLSGDDDPRIPELRQKVKDATMAFVDKWRDRDDYLTDPKILNIALDEYEAWQDRYSTFGAEGAYFNLRSTQNQIDPKIKAKVQQITDFSNDLLNQIQFFELKLAKITPEIQSKLLSDANLSSYHHYLDRLFSSARYQLSEAEERIMNLKSTSAFEMWVGMTSSFLAKAEREVTLEDGTRAKQNEDQILSLISSPQKPVRDEAAKALNEIMAEHASVAEAEMNAILADKKVNDELRGFARPDAARHLADDVDSSVVDALLKGVSQHNAIAQDYYALKAKLLGLNKLEYHERNVEYGAETTKSYDFAAACELVNQVFTRLDPDFAAIFERFLNSGQIDAYPRKGKQSGAFCAYILKSQPTYVLLNHTDKVDKVLTIAHEMGHAINGELMRAQNSLNFGTPLSTAEVASTFMEDFVLEAILQQADDELRLAIMIAKLNDDIGSIFRQVACYQFEQALHQAFRDQGYLSKEAIGELFQKYMSGYMGPAVEQSPGSQNWWVYWGHIRRFFYVYSYASGLLISKSMQSAVKTDHAFIEKVKTFLSAGTSAAPRELFAVMDIDITDPAFWEQGIAEVKQLLDDTAALAKKLGKI